MDLNKNIKQEQLKELLSVIKQVLSINPQEYIIKTMYDEMIDDVVKDVKLDMPELYKDLNSTDSILIDKLIIHIAKDCFNNLANEKMLNLKINKGKSNEKKIWQLLQM